MKPLLRLTAGTIVAATLAPANATAHHEALFGPQSSLAVEAEGFLSLQTHVHAYGTNGQQTTETTTILSGGFHPIPGIPLGVALVQPFTFETTLAPTPSGTAGPFSACDHCLRVENSLVAAQYRFDVEPLQRAWERDGNFVLVSAALEPPTGNKDYAPFKGPFNFIGAAMIGVENGPFASVLIGYYRRNTPDSTSSKKGDSCLLALGVAFTPLDEPDAMLSFQLGAGYEYHFRDVADGTTISESGGGQLLVSPTIVGSPLKDVRLFLLLTLPVTQSTRGDAYVDRWRAGAGLIYSFDKSSAPSE